VAVPERGAPTPLPSPDGTPPPTSSTAPATAASPATAKATSDGGDDEAAIDRLNIRSWELKDIEHLSCLFRTPRSVKRFINTYRFIRAAVRPHEIALFEGAADRPGTYRAALVLLAVVVSFPNVAPRFLRRAADAGTATPEQEWIEFLTLAMADAGAAMPDEPEPQVAPKGTRRSQHKRDGSRVGLPLPPQNWEEVEWQRLCRQLLGLAAKKPSVKTVGETVPWIPIVSRYSFSLSAVLTLDS
jgi:hypothetical protein